MLDWWFALLESNINEELVKLNFWFLLFWKTKIVPEENFWFEPFSAPKESLIYPFQTRHQALSMVELRWSYWTNSDFFQWPSLNTVLWKTVTFSTSRYFEQNFEIFFFSWEMCISALFLCCHRCWLQLYLLILYCCWIWGLLTIYQVWKSLPIHKSTVLPELNCAISPTPALNVDAT